MVRLLRSWVNQDDVIESNSIMVGTTRSGGNWADIIGLRGCPGEFLYRADYPIEGVAADARQRFHEEALSSVLLELHYLRRKPGHLSVCNFTT